MMANYFDNLLIKSQTLKHRGANSSNWAWGLIPRTLFDKLKQRASKATGIRPDQLSMAATHTHSAPASLERIRIPSEAPITYVDQVTAEQ